MTMKQQTRLEALDALVKAIESLKHLDHRDTTGECPVAVVIEAIAAYRAAPKLTREQVEDAILSGLGYHRGMDNLGMSMALAMSRDITDALLPVLVDSGAAEDTHA